MRVVVNSPATGMSETAMTRQDPTSNSQRPRNPQPPSSNGRFVDWALGIRWALEIGSCGVVTALSPASALEETPEREPKRGHAADDGAEIHLARPICERHDVRA